VTWRSLRRHVNQASADQDQIGFRRTGGHHHSMGIPWVPMGSPWTRLPKEPTRTAFTPIRLAWTPCVANSWVHRLEDRYPEGARAPARTRLRSGRASGRAGVLLSFPQRACFREARGLPACSRRPLSFQGRLPRSLATESAIRCTQGAFRSPGHLTLAIGLWLAPTRVTEQGRYQPEGGPLSTGCSQPVEKGPALCLIPRHSVL
jgi:hypothetical protein